LLTLAQAFLLCGHFLEVVVSELSRLCGSTLNSFGEARGRSSLASLWEEWCRSREDGLGWWSHQGVAQKNDRGRCWLGRTGFRQGDQ
jgi:hypothetical protein